MYISFGSSFLSSSSDHIANTGGFVGPYSVLLPDTDETVAEGERPTTYMRYVKSLSSELLKQPLNYNITTDDNSFNKMFGQIAINNTIKHQTMDDTVNPFADYVGKDCSYGNVAEKLILPLIDFTHNGDGESPSVHFKYQLMVDIQETKPDSAKSVLKYLLDKLSSDPKQPVTGPYCSNDATEGYMFDLAFNSDDNADKANFVSGCLEGLDCTPTHLTGCQTCGNAEVYQEAQTTINIELTLYLAIAVCVLTLILTMMGCYVCRVRRQMRMAKVRLDKERRTAGRRGWSEATARAIPHIPPLASYIFLSLCS